MAQTTETTATVNRIEKIFRLWETVCQDKEEILDQYKFLHRKASPLGMDVLNLLYFVFLYTVENRRYVIADAGLRVVFRYVQRQFQEFYGDVDEYEEDAPKPGDAFIDRIVLHRIDATDQEILHKPAWYDAVFE